MYHFINGPKENKHKNKRRILTKVIKIYHSRNDKALGFILDLRVPSILFFPFLRTMVIECLLLDLKVKETGDELAGSL